MVEWRDPDSEGGRSMEKWIKWRSQSLIFSSWEDGCASHHYRRWYLCQNPSRRCCFRWRCWCWSWQEASSSSLDLSHGRNPVSISWVWQDRWPHSIPNDQTRNQSQALWQGSCCHELRSVPSLMLKLPRWSWCWCSSGRVTELAQRRNLDGLASCVHHRGLDD